VQIADIPNALLIIAALSISLPPLIPKE